MKIAVDVMSGEHLPEVLIEGAIDSLKETNADLILVGDKDVIYQALMKFAYNKKKVEIVHSSEVITMNDTPTVALKAKPDASVIVAAKLVKQGLADGFVSPGNTGATYAAAAMNLGRLKGVSRPAILNIIPTMDIKRYCILLDGGANPEVKAINLVQYAVMGSIYASRILGIENPRISILSNGEEETKGTEITRKAYHILNKIPINFSGYAEGRDLFNNSIDVAVCDGFTGNIVLKAIEGTGQLVYNIIKTEIKKNVLFTGLSLIMGKVFHVLKKRMDYAEYGGAPLMGINGTCIITHGSSNSKEIKNAVRVAAESIKNDVNDEIIEKLKEFGVNKFNWLYWEKGI